MKFTTWPLVKREALVRGFRPGSTADAEAPFRTLRRKGSVTAGVTVVVHSGGHIAGKHQAFSALNFDGARLARQDRWDDAHRLEEAAAQVEQSVEMAELVTLLRHLPVDVTEAYLNGHMPAQSDYPMLWHLTTVLAQRTAALREELLGQEGAVSIGVVEPGRGAVTVIKTENGGEVPVPSQLTNGLGLGTVGSIVTLFSDVTAAGQLLMDLLPGFRVSEQDAACRFDPFAATKEPLVIPADAAKKPTRARRRVAAPLPVSG
jgi:hypothetical protein